MAKNLRKALVRIQSRLNDYNKPKSEWGDGRNKRDTGYRLPGSMNRHKGTATRSKRH